MASGWKTLALEDCMSAIIDYRGRSPEKTTSGIPLVTAKIVKGGRIEPPEEFIAEKDFDQWMRRGMPKAGDIVMTTEAPLGEVAQLDGRRVALAQRVITLRGKADVLDNTFLKFLLQSNSVQQELRSRSTGTTVLGIRQSELRRVSLTLPPVSEQKAIGAVLGTLDDKIELNRGMNATLDAMAQALFKSWFVDFDPIHAKAQGRTPPGMDAQTAKLFPSAFVESELGPIPKGWTVERLSRVTSKIGSGATPRGGDKVYADHGIALVRSQNVYDSEFIWDGLVRLRDDDAAKLAGATLRTDDVLLNITGASILRTCVVDPDVLPARVNQHVAIIRAAEEFSARYIHLHLLQPSTKGYLLGLDAGASRQAVTKGHIESVPLVVPPKPVLECFRTLSESIFRATERNSSENRLLSSVRDALLPRLLSGELRLSQAGRVM